MCLVLVFLCALGASVARAGTYEVAVCHDPDTGWTAPTDGISFPYSGSYVDYGVYNSCGNSGYIYATLDGDAPHGPGDLAGWEFQAPADTTIASAELWRAVSAGQGVANAWPIVDYDTISRSGAVNIPWSCSTDWGCGSIGTGPSTEFAAANVFELGGLTDITAIEGTAICGGGQDCAPGGGAVCPELGGDYCIASNHLYAMVVTLNDDTAPTPGDVSGTLVAPGVLSGDVGVSFDATDSGSGLYSTALTVDGATVATSPIASNGGHCVALDDPGNGAPLRFGWTVPCVLAGSGSLSLNTSTLHDGSHSATVTATDAAGNTATVWSGTIETDNAPQGGAPQIFGDAAQGQTLSAATGSWTPAPTGYAYQWERCTAAGASCTAISGATSPAYTAVVADNYHQLAVLVTASNADGSTSVLSQPSAVVLDANGYVSAPPPPAVVAGSPPSISGTAREGDVLDAQAGQWTGGPLSYGYQWQRCDAYGLGCTAVAGASGTSYRLVHADAYYRLRVIVRASGPGGTTEAASEPSPLVADAGGATSPIAAAGGSASTATAPPTGATAATGAQRVSNGIGACADARLRATIDDAASATVALGSPATLHATLRCGGAPVAHAVVRLEIAQTAGSARGRHVQMRTSVSGTLAYVLGSGTSRRITLTYREYTGAGGPSTTATTVLLVTPRISLTISPASTVNGHTITFRGRVSGGNEPPGGLPLELEYLEGSRWMIYTLIRASPRDGSFSYSYTFRRTTQSITYSFRMAIPATGVSGYPYQPAASPPRSVHVDP
jgi:hypothetical protein